MISSVNTASTDISAEEASQAMDSAADEMGAAKATDDNTQTPHTPNDGTADQTSTTETTNDNTQTPHTPNQTSTTGATVNDTASPRASGGRTTVEVGLVLGAGGSIAEAWHAGVVSALFEETGWDARGAALILGTSAGAVTGLGLRAGIPPGDLYAHQKGEPLSREGREILDRVVTEYREGVADHERGCLPDWAPQSPTMTAHALWPPWRIRPVRAALGLLPPGSRTTETLEQRLSEMHPDPWPERRLWVTGVRLDDGLRVVFGRDDITTTAARAIRASCAVPVRYQPVTVGRHRYVDGGVHSATNADLAGPPAFDVVVISSAMSGDAGWAEVAGGLREAWSKIRNGVSAGVSTLGDRLHDAADSYESEPPSPAGRGARPGNNAKPEDRGGSGDNTASDDSAVSDDSAGSGDHATSDDSAGLGSSSVSDDGDGQPWWRDAWSLAWSDGRAVRAARRQWMSDKLSDEVDGLRRRNTLVLVVEPDAETAQSLDSGRYSSDSDQRAEIAAMADQITRRQLRTPDGARLAKLLRRRVP